MSTEWPEYVSHKVVRAARIVGMADKRDMGGSIIAQVESSPGVFHFFDTSLPEMMTKASVGDYAILYSDGYRSISPKRQFEDGYIAAKMLPEEPKTLKKAVEQAINRFSAENGSDTPDFILAEYLMGCLAGFDAAVSARERWYGRVKGMLNNLPGNEKPAEDAPRPALIGDPKAC